MYRNSSHFHQRGLRHRRYVRSTSSTRYTAVALQRLEDRRGRDGAELPSLVRPARLGVARPFNTYGPRQSARAVIPTIISQIAAGMKEIKLGDVSPTRDFNYVLDTCRGMISLAQGDKAIGETVNIRFENLEISIEDVLNQIRALMGSEVTFATEKRRLRPSKSEVLRLWCDNTKLRELTGYAPQWDIREGLLATIRWFTTPENLARYKAATYNV